MKHINIRSFNSDDDQQLHGCYISKVGLTTFTTNKTEKATSVLRLLAVFGRLLVTYRRSSVYLCLLYDLVLIDNCARFAL